jgi:predicted nucleotidyltransferase
VLFPPHGSRDRHTLLKAHEAELRRLGVQQLYLFGSTARDEARPDSDVDLLSDHEWDKLSPFDVMEVQDVKARIPGCPSDAITRNSLHPVLRDRIEASGSGVLMNAPGLTHHPRHRAHTSPRRLVGRRT